jgi:hypothetical protein
LTKARGKKAKSLKRSVRLTVKTGRFLSAGVRTEGKWGGRFCPNYSKGIA